MTYQASLSNITLGQDMSLKVDITVVILLVLCSSILFHVEAKSTLVDTKLGKVRGLLLESCCGGNHFAYLGIPYAKPPVGHLRFKEPEPAPAWSHVLDATQEPPPCLQLDYYNDFQLVGNEDCLYLNVFTKNISTDTHPVLVWFHGGAFKRGSSTLNLYGPDYLLQKDVVLVTLNYRLGSLGFLSTGDAECAGNMGLRDQNMALKWIKDNIKVFGGDPNRVTIFGQSAGGASVHYHMLSPLSEGLFHRAISQSGTSFCYWSYDEDAPSKAYKLSSLLECPITPHKDMLQCLRGKDAADIVRMHKAFVKWSKDDPISPFGPTSDTFLHDSFMPGEPRQLVTEGRFAQVPWMIGVTTSEAALRVTEIMKEPKLVRDLNNNFHKIAPIIFDYEHLSSDPRETSQKIWDFYLGNKTIGDETVRDLLTMYSDRFIVHAVYDASLLHAANTSAPVYFYVLTYRGQYSIVTQTHGPQDKDYGVSHADDLMYLFSGKTFPEHKEGESERAVSNMMVDLWTNFAETGNPAQNIAFDWKPLAADIENFHFLDIQEDPIMSNNFPHYRMKFWSDLHLDDSGSTRSSHDEL